MRYLAFWLCLSRVWLSLLETCPQQSLWAYCAKNNSSSQQSAQKLVASQLKAQSFMSCNFVQIYTFLYSLIKMKIYFLKLTRSLNSLLSLYMMFQKEKKLQNLFQNGFNKNLMNMRKNIIIFVFTASAIF